MEQVRSIEELNELIHTCKAGLGKCQSNIPLSKQVFEKSIERNGCFFEKDGLSLFLFTEEGYYYNLYYIVSKDTDILNLNQKEKDIIVNDAIILNYEDESIEKHLDPLYLKSGFYVESVNHQVVIDLEKNNKETDMWIERLNQFLNDHHYRMCQYKDSFPEEAFILWKKALKVTDIPYDHRSEGHVIAIYDENDEMFAVGWYQNKALVSEWRHVVVDERFRNQGIGKMLAAEWINISRKNGMKKGIGWIETGNVVSFKVHGKMGFEKNGKVNVQYVLPAFNDVK